MAPSRIALIIGETQSDVTFSRAWEIRLSSCGQSKGDGKRKEAKRKSRFALELNQLRSLVLKRPQTVFTCTQLRRSRNRRRRFFGVFREARVRRVGCVGSKSLGNDLSHSFETGQK